MQHATPGPMSNTACLWGSSALSCGMSYGLRQTFSNSNSQQTFLPPRYLCHLCSYKSSAASSSSWSCSTGRWCSSCRHCWSSCGRRSCHKLLSLQHWRACGSPCCRWDCFVGRSVTLLPPITYAPFGAVAVSADQYCCQQRRPGRGAGEPHDGHSSSQAARQAYDEHILPAENNA